MRGSMRSRYPGSWNIIIEGGYQPEPQTGKLKRKQHYYTIRGTKRDAEKKLHELLHAANRGELVEPLKLTLGTWLQTWLETAIKPPPTRLRTYETYKSVINRHVTPALGRVRLQQLQPPICSATTPASPLASSDPCPTSRHPARRPQGARAGPGESQCRHAGDGQTAPHRRPS